MVTPLPLLVVADSLVETIVDTGTCATFICHNVMFDGIFSTNRQYHAIGVENISRSTRGQDKHRIKQ